MYVFLNIAGAFEIFFGICVVALGPTIIHQTFGAVLFGFGILTLGTAAIVDRLERLHRE
jgi:hypothetical protein